MDYSLQEHRQHLSSLIAELEVLEPPPDFRDALASVEDDPSSVLETDPDVPALETSDIWWDSLQERFEDIHRMIAELPETPLIDSWDDFCLDSGFEEPGELMSSTFMAREELMETLAVSGSSPTSDPANSSIEPPSSLVAPITSSEFWWDRGQEDITATCEPITCLLESTLVDSWEDLYLESGLENPGETHILDQELPGTHFSDQELPDTLFDSNSVFPSSLTNSSNASAFDLTDSSSVPKSCLANPPSDSDFWWDSLEEDLTEIHGMISELPDTLVADSWEDLYLDSGLEEPGEPLSSTIVEDQESGDLQG